MSPASLALAPGTLVDSLRVDRILGEGAFGITYLVTDTVLDTTFALKEYLPAGRVRRLDNGALQPTGEQEANRFAEGLGRFLEEGRTVAQLAHSNIVKVFRCFEANGTAYLLMPYYQGEALHKLLARGGTFSEEETLALARPLLDALDHLHCHGIVHRDIKPANIYVTREGAPILLDFGATGQRLGSEGYAALEQSDPESPIGPWTDVHGLAATLYRCTTGQIPPPATERAATKRDNGSDPLVPATQLLGGSALAHAIDHGLALEPADRPQSVADWRTEFSAVAESPPTEEREWLPRILLGVFAVLLVAAVAYLFTGNGRDRGIPTPGAEPSGTTASPQPPVTSPQEARRWQGALEADTVYGYQRFMQDYPESIHNDQARRNLQRLDEQAWNAARENAGRAAIETYLEQFPDGLHRADAEIRLEELRLAEAAARRAREEENRQDDDAWSAAQAERSVAAVEAYLAEWTGGRHGDDARGLLQKLQQEANEQRAFKAAQKLNTIDAYQSYVDAFPRGSHVAGALEAIDDLTLRPGKTFRDCADCPTLVVVPAGAFWQGSEDSSPLALKNETPRRMVNIAEPFAIGTFEVTLGQWDACVAAGGCTTRPGDNGWGRASRPVIMVSWNDAIAYTRWLSELTGEAYNLPSESQWEYAARAGEESDWLGGGADAVCAYANIAGTESGLRWAHPDCGDAAALQTLPVGSLQPNAFGLYDAIGNVAEWTLDCLNLSYLDAPADGSAWNRGICSSHMTRGGSWFTGSREIRLPARFNLKNGDRNDFTGFRVVRKVEM